ncbi:MAG TPA: hypothetical protein VGS97_11575 [Actinocrinis sp.]|uniref:hypothetical protein n=1 Tax=Actinocrinis sp. TaxID=1920516 RepID=UPI002DDD2C43|nr:hypothetical protein [Actinocrinis sp.]HEV2344724.1 hypothetical protein [Actinocrinis sp.]
MLIASGSSAATAARASTPNFADIYLSTWGTAHVTFGNAFATWLARTGATVTAQAPVKLDSDHRGFTMPVSPRVAASFDAWDRMVYPGALLISLPSTTTKTTNPSWPAMRRVIRFGPFVISLMPEVSWRAALSLDGSPTVGEVTLATADYAEVLAGGGMPSPSGFRAEAVPFRLTQELTGLLARESGHGSSAAGAFFGMLTPSFDQVSTTG